MNYDQTTGLPELPAGYRFKVQHRYMPAFGEALLGEYPPKSL